MVSEAPLIIKPKLPMSRRDFWTLLCEEYGEDVVVRNEAKADKNKIDLNRIRRIIQGVLKSGQPDVFKHKKEHHKEHFFGLEYNTRIDSATVEMPNNRILVQEAKYHLMKQPGVDYGNFDFFRAKMGWILTSYRCSEESINRLLGIEVVEFIKPSTKEECLVWISDVGSSPEFPNRPGDISVLNKGKYLKEKKHDFQVSLYHHGRDKAFERMMNDRFNLS